MRWIGNRNEKTSRNVISRSKSTDPPTLTHPEEGSFVHSVIRSLESVLLSNKKEDDDHPVTP